MSAAPPLKTEFPHEVYLRGIKINSFLNITGVLFP